MREKHGRLDWQKREEKNLQKSKKPQNCGLLTWTSSFEVKAFAISHNFCQFRWPVGGGNDDSTISQSNFKFKFHARNKCSFCFRLCCCRARFGHFVQFACVPRKNKIPENPKFTRNIISIFSFSFARMFRVPSLDDYFTRLPNEFIIEFPYSDKLVFNDFIFSALDPIKWSSISGGWRQKAVRRP